ncbi:MAG: hypothetical protein QG632_317 [Candidatus Dependentiae bacterium]|nr:hypothetical protein [Candidatus Dependentiae bacterium]
MGSGVRADVGLSQKQYNDCSLHFVVSLPAQDVAHAVVTRGTSVTITFSGLSMMELQTVCLQQGPHSSPMLIRCLVTATPNGGSALELDLAELAHPVVRVMVSQALGQLIIGIHDAPAVQPTLQSLPLRLA